MTPHTFVTVRRPTRNPPPATLPRMATTARKAATAWGVAALVEEVTLPQRVGDKRFSTHVQLLETERG